MLSTARRAAVRPLVQRLRATEVRRHNGVFPFRGTIDFLAEHFGDPVKMNAYLRLRMQESAKKGKDGAKKGLPAEAVPRRENPLDVEEAMVSQDARVKKTPQFHVPPSEVRVLRAERRERLRSKHKVKDVLHWIRWTRRHRMKVE